MAQFVQQKSTTSLSQCWQLTKEFFQGEKKFIATTGLIILVGFQLLIVFLNVKLNAWNADFYNALQNLDQAEFIKQLMRYGILAIAYTATYITEIFTHRWYCIVWRNWMTNKYLQLWSHQHTYYTTKLLGKEVDNPDQRIANDIKTFSEDTVGLFLGLFNAITTLVSFVLILCNVADVLTFVIWGHKIVIHGYVLWAALLYAVLGTYFTHVLGKPLSKLYFENEKREANFRYEMIRLRENAASVAMYDAINFEHTSIKGRFKQVIQNSMGIAVRYIKLRTLTLSFGYVAIVLPKLILSPAYFAGKITLGVLMKISQAFGRIETALSWIINSYTTLADLQVVVHRLWGFRESIHFSNALNTYKTLYFRTSKANHIVLKNLKVELPGHKLLIQCPSLTLPNGTYLIQGKSGSGKSTLLRTLRGIWPYATGEIFFPKNAITMFIPQKTYMPLGTLKNALIYPLLQYQNEENLHRLLTALDLSHLLNQLGQMNEWGLVLSLGEQQRIAIIRCIVNQPHITFLDEATSSLDLPMGKIAYRLLLDELQHKFIVSIAHRDTLYNFHNAVITIGKDPGTNGLNLPNKISITHTQK